MQRPNTSYAWNAGVAIAYQIVGSAGPDLLFAPGSVTHLDVLWEESRVRRFLTRLAGFSRLVIMDPRGLGLSDRVDAPPTIEERVGDIVAVLDAARCERATLVGTADTGPACIAVAALHSARVDRLILYGTYAKGSWSEDYPIGLSESEVADFQHYVQEDWATPARDTGECEVAGEGLRGMAVHIGARVSSAAAPGEVLVSQTVKDLVVGSGISFDDRGEHHLKGVEGSWRLYAVSGVE